MARKEKLYHFIYKTTNLLNNKYYYGMHSTDDLNDGYMGSGKRLRYSINKYGKENHLREIIEFLPNRKALVEKEKEVVNLNEIAKEDCMNLMVGGEGGFVLLEYAKKGRAVTDKIMTERLGDNWRSIQLKNWYRNSSDEVKKLKINKCIETNKKNGYDHKTFLNKRHSLKTIELMKMKKINHGIGEKNSQFGTCWITKDGINKKIKLIDINSFILDGWVKGRSFK